MDGANTDSLSIENVELYYRSKMRKPHHINQNYFIYHKLVPHEYKVKIIFADGRILNRKIVIKKDSLTVISIFSRERFDFDTYKIINKIFDTLNVVKLFLKDFNKLGSVEGHVTDYDKPINLAGIRILNLGWSSGTDSNGYYSFPYLPPGEYNVQAYSMNTYRTTYTNVKVYPAETSIVNFGLSYAGDFDAVFPWVPNTKKH